MLKNQKILIISPHPDDEAICCGGLIALAKKEMASVYVLYIAVGTSRQFFTNKTSAKNRIPEIKDIAHYGNFQYSILFKGKQFMRLDTVPQKELIEKIEDTTEQFKPTIVCLPFRFSFDQDHRAVSLACLTAFRPLPPNLHPQPKILMEYEEPYSWTTGDVFQPNLYLDISAVLEEKINLLKCHKSQLRKDPFPRSPENLTRLAGYRGCEIGVRYAEAYKLLKGQLL